MPTRRAFIKTIIVAGGAVFTDWSDLVAGVVRRSPRTTIDSLRYAAAHEFLRDRTRTAKFPAPRGSFDCVIIGGGISGLSAAWKLMKEGRSFVILDGEPVAGGAARSGNWHGHRYSMGSGYYVTYEGIYKELYDDIKIHPQKTGEDALWFGRDGMHVDWWTDEGIANLPIPGAERDAFKRFRDELTKFDGLPEYPLSGASPAKIAQYDSISTRQYLSKFGSSQLLTWMNQYNMSSCGGSLDEVNAYCFLNFYASEFGDSLDLPRYSFPGGIAGMVDRLLARIGSSHIRTKSLTIQVVNESGGVSVGYLDSHGVPRAVRGRTAILSGQKRISRNLVPEMPTEQKDLCSQVRYAPYITVNLLCRRQLLPKRAFDVWFSGDQLMFTDMVDGDMVGDMSHGKPDRSRGEFTYCVYCPQHETERKRLQEPEYLASFAQQLAANLDAHIPGAHEAVIEMHVFAFGHTMVIPAVNSHALFHPGISRPVGRIHFANTDNDLSPSVESGIANGIGAAEAVLEEFGKG